MLKSWYDELERRSGGRIKVEWFWSSSLCNVKDLPEFLRRNVAQAGICPPNYNPSIFQLQRAGDIPYITTKSDALARAVHDAYQVNEALRRDFEEDGLMPLFSVAAVSAPISSKEPAHKWEDFQGMKMRVPGSLIPIFSNWGIVPIAVPFNDITEALERGVIEGATDVWFSSLVGMGMPELAGYCIDPGDRLVALLPECMSLEYYNSLPDDLKAFIDDMIDTGWRIPFDTQAELIHKYARELAATDMQFIRWSPAESKRAMELVIGPASDAYFGEMAEAGMEKEARELYEFLKAMSKQYEADSILPDPFKLIEQYGGNTLFLE